MDALFSALSLTPKQVSGYELALTHPSVSRKANYERLEFLGDAVIELITTEYLFHKYPDYPEGKMTKLRAKVVARPSLAGFARQLSLPQYMRFSPGERRSKGHDKDTNLCNAFEAFIGAIYLDLGYAEAERVFLHCSRTTLDAGYLDLTGEENPKGRLQEILQAIHPVAPEYRLISEDGPDHQRVFQSEVYWQQRQLGLGKGSSKKAAESAAALNALEKSSWNATC